MEFFDDLSVPVKFLIAFVVALAMLGVGGYLMRRFSGPRGRQPRLAVINAASVDGRRRLVLVRRDDVEHLLLIGGPTDVVIESNIDRSGAVAPAPVPEPKASPPLPPPRQTFPGGVGFAARRAGLCRATAAPSGPRGSDAAPAADADRTSAAGNPQRGSRRSATANTTARRWTGVLPPGIWNTGWKDGGTGSA